MSKEYKKITKEDVNLPEYCLFFIESIQKEIDDTDFEEYTELELTVDTSEYPYCYDAFELVVKTFSRKGFYTRVPTFTTSRNENGKKVWTYKWLIREINNCDDLPF